jgi:hypothetical protein
LSVDTVLLPVGTAIVSAVVGWSLSELSHRSHRRREAADELARQHRLLQVEVLVDLQHTLLEFYSATSRYLWLQWSAHEEPEDPAIQRALDETFEETEDATRAMFAVSARCADFRAQGAVDYIEEMGRNFTTMPGRAYVNDGTGRYVESAEVVRKDDSWLERTVILTNNRIGDRILALTGARNAELSFFDKEGAVDPESLPWTAPIEEPDWEALGLPPLEENKPESVERHERLGG